MSGIVIHKNGVEGMYVKTGTKIYTIADLSHVWVKLDAYESDLVWIRYGQEVEFETKAYPGESFKGQITFIDPILNPKTRTVKVRVNVPNPDGKLKPDMFVSARVFPKVAAGGRVMDPALEGKWICPMHPEIVKDTKDRCDICGMPLVTAESLGYVTADAAQKEAPLVIPATAPLITGKRAVVYVTVPGKEGTYEGREIILGPRAGNYYLVKEGLQEGEQVVVNGNFKIDSAIQILAKPSMMSPEEGVPSAGDQEKPPQKVKEEKMEVFKVPDTFKTQIDGVFSAYFEVQQALSQDNFNGAQSSAKSLFEALNAVDMKLLTGSAHMAWMKDQKDLKKSAQEVISAKDIEGARSAFIQLSDSLYAVAKKFGTSGKQPILRFHCPMAAGGEGAYWLQNKPGTENPYYGSAMFKCGDQVEAVSPVPVKEQSGGHQHE
jgi:Cu(I)/Ag(I) efflux system membrane fusion protein